jgi:hypothetical protein
LASNKSRGRGRRYAHVRKKPDSDGFVPYMAHTVCDACGKQCYLTREEARRSARVNHPGTAMHAYTCTEPSGKTWWHLSSIPAYKLKELRDQGHCG